MLVATPPMRNSRSVRVALCTTSVQLPTGECTMTLASSESKAVLVR